MKCILTNVFAVLGILCIILLQRSPAEIYKYTDKKGTESYTDNPQSIPPEYRKKAEIIDRQLEKRVGKSSDDHLKEGVSSPEKEKKGVKFDEVIKGFIGTGLFKAIAGIIIFLFIFVLIGKISSSMGYEKAGAVIRIFLTLLVLLYVFSTQLNMIVNAFTLLKEEVLGVKKQADERNETVNKDINELFKESGK